MTAVAYEPNNELGRELQAILDASNQDDPDVAGVSQDLLERTIAELDQLTDDLSDKETEIEDLESNVSTLEWDCEERDEEIAKLIDERDDFEEELATAHARIAELEAELEDVKDNGAQLYERDLIDS